MLREAAKALARGAALIAMLPALFSFWVRSRIMGGDRALQGSTQALAMLPGLMGQYLRRAFLSRVLAECHPTATIEFGTICSKTGARLEAHAYIGPRCHLGLVHIGREALLAAGVHVPSGPLSHGIDDAGVAIRDQAGAPRVVSIGAGAWIGSAAVVMANVGCHTIVGAGAVVTRPVPDCVVAAGVPARVQRSRTGAIGRPA